MKLLVVGSSNTDMVVKTKNMPIPGETVLGGDFGMHFGGKGANQAVCAKKLGMDTGFITCLGNDIFGQNTIDYFKSLGLNIDKINIPEGVASGVALITVDEKGENSIVVAGGANNCLLPEHIEDAKDYINGFDGVLVQFEIPMETVLKTIEIAHDLGKFVAVNPAPANTIPDKYFPMIDVLIPNRNEARQLLGMAPDDESLSPEELAGKLKEKGVRNAVITLGTKGSLIATEKGNYSVDSYKVKAEDTTGAGDSYCASFVCACLWGKDLEEAGKFATAVSAIKVTKMGAQNTPTLKECEDFIKQMNK